MRRVSVPTVAHGFVQGSNAKVIPQVGSRAALQQVVHHMRVPPYQGLGHPLRAEGLW